MSLLPRTTLHSDSEQGPQTIPGSGSLLVHFSWSYISWKMFCGVSCHNSCYFGLLSVGEAYPATALPLLIFFWKRTKKQKALPPTEV